jgi:hypothetical protein
MGNYVYKRRRYFIAPIILIVVAILGLLVMVLWNALMPALFNLPTINFLQASGLLVLSRLLFGLGRPYSSWSRRYWRPDFREKISKMTPEEKKEFFKKMHTMRHSWYQKYCETPETEEKEEGE